MATKNSNTARKGNAGRQRQAEEPGRGMMEPVIEAIRAHPVAAAAAVAAGGAVAARLVRGGKAVAADTARQPKAAAKRPGGAGGGLSRPVQPDAQLAEVVGKKPLTRADLTKRLWDYIKTNGLQDATNRRMINADDRLRPIFGKDQVSMFEMTRLVNQHVSAAA